jgi:hypothetical protein
MQEWIQGCFKMPIFLSYFGNSFWRKGGGGRNREHTFPSESTYMYIYGRNLNWHNLHQGKFLKLCSHNCPEERQY